MNERELWAAYGLRWTPVSLGGGSLAGNLSPKKELQGGPDKAGHNYAQVRSGNVLVGKVDNHKSANYYDKRG